MAVSAWLLLGVCWGQRGGEAAFQDSESIRGAEHRVTPFHRGPCHQAGGEPGQVR